MSILNFIANEFVLDAQIKLGNLLKEMPKNEGGTPEKKQYKNSTSTKMEPVETPPTYTELGIAKKDAAQWQFMAEHKDQISERVKEKKSSNQPAFLFPLKTPYNHLKSLQWF